MNSAAGRLQALWLLHGLLHMPLPSLCGLTTLA